MEQHSERSREIDRGVERLEKLKTDIVRDIEGALERFREV